MGLGAATFFWGGGLGEELLGGLAIMTLGWNDLLIVLGGLGLEMFGRK